MPFAIFLLFLLPFGVPCRAESKVTGELHDDNLESEAPVSPSRQFAWSEGNTLCRDLKCGGVVVPLDLSFDGSACPKLADFAAASHAYYHLAGQILVNTSEVKGYGYYLEMLEDSKKSAGCTRANLRFNYASGQPPDKDCKARSKILNPKVDHPIEVEQVGVQLAKSSPQVIFVGESHDTASQHLYDRVVSGFKTAMPDLDCVFLEIPPEEFKSTVAGARQAAVDPASMAANFVDIVRVSDKLHLKLIPADSAKRPENLPDEGANYELRNHGMASTVLKNFSGGERCHRAVFPVGMAHLSKTSETPGPYRTLSSMVPPLKLRSAKVFLTDVGSDSNSETPFTWNTCTSNPALPKNAGAFSNQGFPKELKILNGFTTGGSWADFDYTIFNP